LNALGFLTDSRNKFPDTCIQFPSWEGSGVGSFWKLFPRTTIN
jgi:hypothetical protein